MDSFRLLVVQVFNPLTGSQIAVSQAIHLGLIGRDLASYYNPATDESISIDDAVRRGLAITRSVGLRRILVMTNTQVHYRLFA